MTQLSDLVTPAVMGRVVAYRKQRKMSAAKLADACTAAGHPISRAVLASLENGRRASVGVDDLLAFAHVLDVPVLELLYGVDALDAPSPLALPVGSDTYPAALILAAQDHQTFLDENGDERGAVTPLQRIAALAESDEAVARAVPRVLQTRHQVQTRTLPEPSRLGLPKDREMEMLLEWAVAESARERWSFLSDGVPAPPMTQRVREGYLLSGAGDLLEALEEGPARADSDDARRVEVPRLIALMDERARVY